MATAAQKEKTESEICAAIKKLRDDCASETTAIRKTWRENYDMFCFGSRSQDKEDWQSQFSVNKLATSTRTAQGRLVRTLVQDQDWFDLEPRSKLNQAAAALAPALRKIMDYYLKSSNFKRHAGTFFLTSLISSGSVHVGWRKQLIQNPEYLIAKTEAQREEDERRLAKSVANPEVEAPDALSASVLEAKLAEALDEFSASAQGETIAKPKLKPYIQIGQLDIRDINHERTYWEPNVMYMEDSIWRQFEYDVPKYELNQMVKLGLLKKSAVDRIGNTSVPTSDYYNGTQRLRYGKLNGTKAGNNHLVKITIYEGPLIVNDQIKRDKYRAIIANDTVILKDGEYPYWEPPGHHTSIVTAAVRQIPYRATGQGLGDNAVNLQKTYDSNWMLICDTFRQGISGINVVNYTNVVDKSQLDEGIQPGMTLEVRGKPDDSFKRIDLTSNIENQAHPVQAMFEQAIDFETGVNELMTGGGNQYSRTTSTETNARLQAGQENVNTVALDLEQNFLIPVLEKIFARILQFGIPELPSNPELMSLLTEEEQAQIQELNTKSRLEILNQWYTFKVNGFSSAQDKNAQAQRDNELLTIVNSGGPLSQLINIPELAKHIFKNQGIKNPELLIIQDSPFAKIVDENKVLMAGHLVVPAEDDDHEYHIQQQSQLAALPGAPQAVIQHVQYHEQMLQQMQMATQAQQGGQPPQTIQ